MHSDKKTRNGKLRVVLTPRIGKAASYDDVPVKTVDRVVRFGPHFFCDSSKANG
jgi:3-dehydroquinate synthetase